MWRLTGRNLNVPALRSKHWQALDSKSRSFVVVQAADFRPPHICALRLSRHAEVHMTNNTTLRWFASRSKNQKKANKKRDDLAKTDPSRKPKVQNNTTLRWFESRSKNQKKTNKKGDDLAKTDPSRKPKVQNKSRVHDIARILSSAPHIETRAGDLRVNLDNVAPELLERRGNASRILGYFLSRDPEWLESVDRLVRKDFSEEYTPILDGSTTWYYSSVPSFRERLLSHDYPEAVQLALDKLVAVGFDCFEFRRKYRDMFDYLPQFSNIQSAISDQQQTCLKHKLEMETIQNQIEDLVKTLEDIASEEKRAKEPKQEESSSLWKWMTAPLNGLLSPSPDKTKSIIKDETSSSPSLSNASNIKSLNSDLSRKKKVLESLNKKIATSEHQLENMQEVRKSMEAPLPKDVHDAANAALEATKSDFCNFLADHISERYRLVFGRYKVLDQQTDLTRPHEWFPYARLLRRKIVFHAGPTNSGKTFHALERLKEAKKGLYLAPLRLLAAEVYERLTVEGYYCNLMTGQEKREIPFSTHTAATVEMASTSDKFDVVVIDEIQMIADVERGFAWTRALLGANCPEIHVCGGAEAEPILRKLAAVCGDDLEIYRYERFSELEVAKKSLAKSSNQIEAYRNVQAGDCIVAFARNDIFAIKREIERLTNFKCCVVYGSLPPQTRSEQARLFNDPNSGYDILVASDAIGMGLNLNIRRIVFNSIYKNDGRKNIRLGHSAVKQISGRAGRRNSVFPDGLVTCRCPQDLPYITQCLSTDIAPIQRAGLLPTASHFETFNSSLQAYKGGETTQSNMYYILKQFGELASLKNDFFLCRQTAMHDIAREIDEYQLPITDKYTLCMCPVSTKNKKSMEVLKRFAAKMSMGEVAGLPNRMIPRKPKNFEDLAALCGLFSDLDLFLWLQNKFPPGNFLEQRNALAIKETTISMIGDALQETKKLQLQHSYVDRDLLVRRDYAMRHRPRKEKERSKQQGTSSRVLKEGEEEEEEENTKVLLENVV